ncbi:MAG: Tetratricopeptide repeat/TPR repeat [Phormidesmis priestleyi Ana]|uniref:Tetratricopeptide repeat/TPR repeat n=1 Tax=Phormidesmis priestleyi Ana TaxID=1666911 RepID=A0A0P7ZMZ4_9CYAN|nr:MAG: Tetratricopeptide repeat/TPR repeat [Phormidesmis priestleyi Ana]
MVPSFLNFNGPEKSLEKSPEKGLEKGPEKGLTEDPIVSLMPSSLESNLEPNDLSIDLSSAELTCGSSSFLLAHEAKKLLSQGFERHRSGNYKGAIEKFDQVILIQKELPEVQGAAAAKVFLYRAQTLMQMRAYDAAIKDFRQVLKNDPYNARAWHGQGVAKAELKLYPSAVDSFQQAIVCDPNNDKIWYNLGRTLLKLEQYERALEKFDKTIELNGSRYHAWYSRALAQSSLELIQPAIESLDRAIALKESCHYAWNYRGTLLNRLFKHPEALKSFWKSLEYRVPNPNAWYGLACTYALMNNPDATAIHLRQATEFNPNIYSLMARNDISFDLVRDHPKVRMILCN